MEHKDYEALKRKIVPGLRFNQAIYEEVVTEHVTEQTVWLDAGCGWHVFPAWRAETEKEVAMGARLAIGCDVDLASLRQHRTLSRLVLASLEALPFRSESVSLITCNMVAEHLDRPLEVFAEFARILPPGGRVIVHTPNIYSLFVIASRLMPRSLKLRLVERLDGRSAGDVFPTRYRANTPRTLRCLMARVGLEQERCSMLTSDAALATAHPLLAAANLLYIRLTLTRALRYLRSTMLGCFVKPARRAA
ncbi:MAG: class I SAM-dependent methyltransferase [Candidatus Rokubacteria bacterium]|nr:class I SAM-dependent methyltransferase [Candidatus Rokubacteria bacterium]